MFISYEHEVVPEDMIGPFEWYSIFLYHDLLVIFLNNLVYQVKLDFCYLDNASCSFCLTELHSIT